MKIPDDEKKIIDFLIKEYPVLEEFKTKIGYLNKRKEKVKQILEIIDTDENLIKYHILKGLYKIRKGKPSKTDKNKKNNKKVKKNSINIEEVIQDSSDDNNSEESENVIDDIEQMSESINEEVSKKINEYSKDEFLINYLELITKKIEEGKKKKFTMIDLFSGTGAFSVVFSKYNIECNFANDFYDKSKQIFDLNHKIKLTYGDLIKIKNEDIPKHNILCGGFPCQPFSIAGNQNGFNDERSNVFWKILNIIKYHNPEIVILENVKNLQSHDKGNTFKTIYAKISELGYFIKYEILNTCKITNIPQNRERIYIVCFKNKKNYDEFNFNFEQKNNLEIKSFLEEKIDDNYYYSDRFKVYNSIKEGVIKSIDENVIYQYRRYYVRENKNNVCPTLTANMGGGGHNVPLLKD